MKFRKRHIKILVQGMALGIAWGIAIVSVFIALGVINTPTTDNQLFVFLRNVGYGIFAGGVLVCLVELSKSLVNSLKRDTG